MAKSQIDLSPNFYDDNQIGSNSISQSKISDRGKEIKEEQNVKQGYEKERKKDTEWKETDHVVWRNFPRKSLDLGPGECVRSFGF